MRLVPGRAGANPFPRVSAPSLEAPGVPLMLLSPLTQALPTTAPPRAPRLPGPAHPQQGRATPRHSAQPITIPKTRGPRGRAGPLHVWGPGIKDLTLTLFPPCSGLLGVGKERGGGPGVHHAATVRAVSPNAPTRSELGLSGADWKIPRSGRALPAAWGNVSSEFKGVFS